MSLVHQQVDPVEVIDRIPVLCLIETQDIGEAGASAALDADAQAVMGRHALFVPKAQELLAGTGGERDGRGSQGFCHLKQVNSWVKVDKPSRFCCNTRTGLEVQCLAVDYLCRMTWSIVFALLVSSAAVIVAVWLMFRLYFRHQTQMYVMEGRRSKESVTLPLRLQAYERLILLFSRIDIPDLVLRLKAPGSSAGALKAALLLAIQQEFEHNLTQQLYVSESLWQVLQQARMQTMDLVMAAADGVPEHEDSEFYARKLIDLALSRETLPAQIAIRAIKTESALWL